MVHLSDKPDPDDGPAEAGSGQLRESLHSAARSSASSVCFFRRESGTRGLLTRCTTPLQARRSLRKRAAPSTKTRNNPRSSACNGGCGLKLGVSSSAREEGKGGRLSLPQKGSASAKSLRRKRETRTSSPASDGPNQNWPLPTPPMHFEKATSSDAAAAPSLHVASGSPSAL